MVVAVLVPCLNEEKTIASVVRAFRAELPEAEIYVFDNNSTDASAEEARAAGAIVRVERRQGKGYVIQSMFRTVEADVYVIVDGDGTYPASAVHPLIAPVIDGSADMVVGSRLHARSQSQFKKANRFGNRFFARILNSIFSVKLTDVLSGYRAFSRPLIKSLPFFGGGFEIEIELTIKALERGFRILEVPVDLSPRPAGSYSKIRILTDGFLILNTILALFRDYKPLTFFSVAGLICFAAAGLIVFLGSFGYISTAGVLGLPVAVAVAVIALSGLLLIAVGLILHTVVRRFQEFEHQMQTISREIEEKKNDLR